METLTHPESRRLYSWWWDSHISPKNSKWLHENLTDMDVKVKTMIKLIEEDADSFARRAEMYYKKRPELMKLVEELYRAYRALAERYDHATGELRQAQRTMAEAFPNQMPFILPDDTPPGSSMTDTEPHTPEMPRPIRALFDQDDLQTETLDVSSDFHAIKRNGVFPEGNDTLASKKGLKQLNEMFNENILPEYGESKVRKGLNFQVEEGKGPDFKARNGTGVPHKHELEGQERGTQYEELDLEERGDGDNESSSLQEDEVSQLLIENENLKMQLLSESERSAKAEKEVYDLREVLSKLKDEKEAALLQYQQCLDRYNNASERIAGLKMEVSLAQEEARGLNDEILKGVAKWRGFEERSIMLERENQNLQIEMDGLVHRLMTQQEEMKEKHDELEKLRICIQEERLNCARMDAALQNFQQLHARSQEEQRVLMVELQNGVQFLKEMESKKHDLEEEIIRIREENNCLNEQNMSSVISIKNSQDELCSLMEKNQKLEEEVGFRVDQRNALQQELYCLKEEINDFERRYRGVIVQIESVGFNPESLQASVRALWNENSNLKDTCQRNSEEKQVLLERLRNMDKLSEKNNFLENSLSDMSIEIDDLRGKVKCFEKSCRSLEEDKTTLITENGSLLFQVESVMKGLCDMESVHLELQDRHSGLKTEKELMVNEVKEIHDSLELQKCEHENLIKSSNVQIATLRDQIDLLQEECRLRKLELEEQEDKSMNSQLELYVLRLCIHDMKEMYDAILIECRKHIKESAAAGKLVSELEQKNLRQEAKFKSLVSEHSLTALINQKLLMGIQELLQVLNMVDNRYSGIKDEVFVQNILGKVKALQVYILYEQDEKQRLVFENLMNATFLEQMRCGILDLIAEKEAIETESLRRKNELLLLESEKHELAEMNSQLRQEVVGVMSREEMLKTEMGFVKKQLSDLEESDQALTIENHKLFEENQSMKKVVCDVKEEKCMLEEENDAILGEALKLVNLGSIFEGFSVEKALELQRVNGDLDDFRIIKSNLEKEISAMMAKMEILEIERLKLKESIQELEEDRTHAVILLEELNSVRDVCQNLNCEISIGKNLLSEKEIELVIAGENLEAEQKEKAKLTRDLESIKRESDEVWEIRKSLEKQISVLSEEKIDLQNEITSIRTEKVGLEFELDKLSKEIDGFRVREENLNSELGNWEAENTAVLVDLQSSLINATMFKEKVYELIEACESLEKNARIWERNVNSELSFWEAEAGSSFVELQTSSIRAALLEEKVCELIGAYDNLKEDSQMEREKFCEIRKNLVMQNFVLSEQKIDLEKEITSVHEEKVGLEFELDKLSKEINRFRIREENLNSELGNWEADTAKILVDLQLSSIREALLEEKVCKLIEACENLEENALVWERKVNSELGVFEAEAAASFVELQTSHIRAVLLEGKVCELIGACDNLEENTHMEREKFLNEIALRNMDIDELKGKIALLEEENGLMKAESAMYLPPVLSLRDSLSSLEECSLSLTKAHGNGVLELQGSVTMCHQNNTTSTHELSEGQVSKIPDGVLELQKLQSKVQAVEKVLMELARLDQPIEDENVGKNQENSNLGTATGETEELELQSSVVQEEDQTSKGIIIEQDHEIGELGNDLEPEKIESGITKVKHGPLTKDIQLDHVSDTSCYEKSVSKNLESEDQMLELWETAEQDCGRKPIPNKDIEYHQPEVVEELKSENPSSELQAEKELRVDNVAGLTRVAGSHHKRTMSRLSSNARRLKNLQLTAQELNNKCEGSKRSNQPTGYEYENVKAQLKEVEETILAYVDVNAQLIKNAEDGSSETGVGTEKNKEGSENVQKQQGPELARKGSLNIGKLELEVQRIQFLVHKLEEERSFKGDVGGERRTRILLRDYIYSYVGREKGRKKGKFCACMRPSTSSD